MKMASWGCCISVFDPSGEPAAHPGVVPLDFPGGSGTELDVGPATSKKEVFGPTTSASLDIPLSLCSACVGNLGKS